MAWTKAPEDERRRQILDAALAVAARDGLRGTTLRAVAARAGLSHGLVLFHFGSKQALVDALLDDVLRWLTARGAPAAAPGDVWELAAAEAAAVDPLRTSVLLGFWVLAPTDPAVRRRIAESVARYESELAAAAPGRDPADRDRLAGRAATIVFGSALRALLAAAETAPPPPDTGTGSHEM